MSHYFDVVESKLAEADSQLRTMGKVIIHPMDQPGASRHLAAIAACPGTVIGHNWHELFNAAVNAFLSATRSVPDIIRNRFGFDRPDKNTWLRSLGADEKCRRKQFTDRFEIEFKKFRALPLNEERNEAHHGSGMAHWVVEVQGQWDTYFGGPSKPLPQFESRPPFLGEDPPLGWLDGAYTRELRFSWTDFWWEIPQDGAPPLRLPLFEECKRFLEAARKLGENGRALFTDIHEGQAFTPPPW